MSGFGTLASLFPDRTVVTYDPRGLGRSTRSDGRRDNDPDAQAEDLHALAAALGAGPVDVFASSGGAVTGLPWATRYPGDRHRPGTRHGGARRRHRPPADRPP